MLNIISTVLHCKYGIFVYVKCQGVSSDADSFCIVCLKSTQLEWSEWHLVYWLWWLACFAATVMKCAEVRVQASSRLNGTTCAICWTNSVLQHFDWNLLAFHLIYFFVIVYILVTDTSTTMIECIAYDKYVDMQLELWLSQHWFKLFSQASLLTVWCLISDAYGKLVSMKSVMQIISSE